MAESTRSKMRAEGRRARRGVVGEQRAEAQRALHGHLLHLHLPPAVTVGAYIADDGEPALDDLVSTLRRRGLGVALPVPTPGSDASTMSFVPWDTDDELTPGRFGIPCPPPGAAVVPRIVLVPLVRFDRYGNRLGRGAGFYDRWLATHSAEVATIGVAFECQRAARVPRATHDVPLPMIVTDLGIRRIVPMGVS